MYENGIFKDVLGVGQYAFWKGIINREFQKIDLKSRNHRENFYQYFGKRKVEKLHQKI